MTATGTRNGKTPGDLAASPRGGHAPTLVNAPGTPDAAMPHLEQASGALADAWEAAIVAAVALAEAVNAYGAAANDTVDATHRAAVLGTLPPGWLYLGVPALGRLDVDRAARTPDGRTVRIVPPTTAARIVNGLRDEALVKAGCHANVANVSSLGSRWVNETATR